VSRSFSARSASRSTKFLDLFSCGITQTLHSAELSCVGLDHRCVETMFAYDLAESIAHLWATVASVRGLRWQFGALWYTRRNGEPNVAFDSFDPVGVPRSKNLPCTRRRGGFDVCSCARHSSDVDCRHYLKRVCALIQRARQWQSDVTALTISFVNSCPISFCSAVAITTTEGSLDRSAFA